MMKTSVTLLAFIVASLCKSTLSCTDILVTPGASEDGSAMLAYNADSGCLMGMLYHYPKTTGKGRELRKIYDWDSGVFLGTIPEVNETYNVVGNVNEHGLSITESTFGGVEILGEQTNATIDYGSLIYITLQRSKTALEAIHTIVDLMDTHGYYSQGESFSIADKLGQVWIMEVIGRGDNYDRKGAVWVARKIPNGFVSAHSNHARITTFPRDDPDNCKFADDVVDLAVHYGLCPATADPLEFSFSDVYDPLDFGGARMSEARTWSALSSFADEDGTFRSQHADYAAGRDLTNRMPLWVKPYKKLTVQDVIHAMASHYECTELDPSLDVGAGMYAAPYRPRPLNWEFAGEGYHNERTIATQQTSFSLIAQVRPWMPEPISALLWFGVDDSSTGPRFPVYGGSTNVSKAYYGKGPQDGVMNPLLTFDMSKAFWVYNMVANFAYSRWSDIYPIIQKKLNDIQTDFQGQVASADKKAASLYKANGTDAAVDYVTDFSVKAGDKLHDEWLKFYGQLFVRFRDFFDIQPDKSQPNCGCNVIEGGMDDSTKKRIVSETGDHYRVLDENKVEAGKQVN